jgi:hypothetical protein
MSIRRVLALFTILLFVHEDDLTMYHDWLSPRGWANAFLFFEVPQQIHPFD